MLALVIGIALLIFVYFKTAVYATKESLDFHLHDTYFVLSYPFAIGFVVLFLGIFFSVGGIIGSRFKGKLFWMMLLLFLAAGFWYFFPFFQLLNE